MIKFNCLYKKLEKEKDASFLKLIISLKMDFLLDMERLMILVSKASPFVAGLHPVPYLRHCIYIP